MTEQTSSDTLISMKYRRVQGRFTPKLVTKIQNAGFVLLGISITAFSGWNYIFASSVQEFISPLGSPKTVQAIEVIPTPTSTPTPTPLPEQMAVEKEIRHVFGKYADQAFKVLKCENASLNPKAVNTAGNTPKGSRDIGVFQINEYWQGVNGKFLLEPDINVRIAYKIFKDNGHSWERWTCGRKLGFK